MRWAMFSFLSFTAACNDSGTVKTEFPASYDYKLDLPTTFERQQVSGIDSKVEEFRSSDTAISTDFGLYSGPPTCSSANQACDISKERIAGREALVGLYRHGPNEWPGEPKPHRVFVHVSVDERHGLALNLFARCDTRAACNEALRYFRQVRLLRLKRPPMPMAPAPPRPAAANGE